MKRWFGVPKAVYENGNPLICFHGSTVNIEEFDDAFSGDNTGNNLEKVFYFTTDEEIAITYSQEADNDLRSGPAKRNDFSAAATTPNAIKLWF